MYNYRKVTVIVHNYRKFNCEQLPYNNPGVELSVGDQLAQRITVCVKLRYVFVSCFRCSHCHL
jgi:hypothetical protein